MNLKSLSDSSLHKGLIELARRERALLSQILAHLREVDNRKLYSAHQCSSLFDYCVRMLKYSEGQAARRVSASRLLREVPELTESILRGELNLTHLNQANSFFKEEGITNKTQKAKVLEQIKGKTTRESESLLWSLKQADTPRKVIITIMEDTREALEELKNLGAHKVHDLDGLLMEMARITKAAWLPQVQRRSSGARVDRRYVPAQIKASVWKRDQGRCKNCGGRHALQYDHIMPFGAGGKTKLENLQLLCRNCNQWKGSSLLL
jgi:Asp-tRNA(Asn)/Glu-tRNA(Gln) amidotransferase B subunit